MTKEIDCADSTERRRTVIVHRIGVGAFLLLLSAAFVGLLGSGPFSYASISSADRILHVEYCRFVRYEAPASLKIQIAPTLSTNGEVEFWLSRTFVDKVEIQRIEPEPISTIAGPNNFHFKLRAETNRLTPVRVRFVAQHFGKLAYEVGLASGPTLKVQHVAFP